MNTNQSQGMSEDKNLRDQVIFYLRNWGWFVFGVIVAMSVAFLYIRYSTPYYQTISSIVIKDSKDSGGATELAALEEVGLITGMNSNSIENELEILKSRRLLLKVIEKLQLHKFYFIEGNLRSSEIFGDRPFEFNILQEDESSFYEKSFMIYDMSLSSYKIKDL